MTDEYKPLIVEGEDVGEYIDTTFSFDKYQMAPVELWTSPREFDAYQYDWDAFKEFYKPDNEDEMYAECEDEDFTPGMNGIDTIDIVAVNLYPFKETVAKPDVTLADAIENIDIGGPSMVRSAAKNYKDVAVLTNPNQYGIYLDSIKGNISIKPETLRRQFMLEAFKHTAEYDAAISAWMSENV